MDNLISLVNEFHFIRPAWLAGLLVLIAIAYLRRKHPPQSSIDELVDAHLQAVVVDTPQLRLPATSRYLPGLLAGLLIIALAGPTWQQLPQPLYQLQQGRVVVLSLAKSMDREDIQPSRLHRAKFKIEDLLSSAPGVLTGLVGFAGEAFVITPLSDDQDTISNLLQSLDSDTLPVQGIQAERGLEKARELLTQVRIDAGEIILITDQASPLAVSAARALSNESLRVSVLEIAPPDNRSQSALLKSIADAGRGTYVRLTPDDADIEALNRSLKTWLAQSRGESSETLRKGDQWRDMGPWLLIPVLLLSSLLFRRGLLGVLPFGLLAGLLSAPQPVQAYDWRSLWERADQQQARAVQAYRNQDMPAALQGFARDKSATGAYNLGTALANSGQLEGALEAYNEALQLQPGFEDAQYNRDIVAAALQQQQEQEQEKQQQDQQSGEKPENSEQSSKGEEDQKGQENPDQESQGEPSEQADSAEEESSSGQNQDAESEPAEQNENGQAQSSEEAQASEQQAPENESAELDAAAQTMDEDAQALELMLRQVPDDPGALLRRKFKYQYQNRQP